MQPIVEIVLPVSTVLKVQDLLRNAPRVTIALLKSLVASHALQVLSEQLKVWQVLLIARNVMEVVTAKLKVS